MRKLQVQGRQQSFNFRFWRCSFPNLVLCLPPWRVRACSSAFLSLPMFYLLESDFISARYPLAYTRASCCSSYVPIRWLWADQDLGIPSFFQQVFIGHLLRASRLVSSSLWLLCAGVLQLFSSFHGTPDLLAPHWLAVCASTLNFSHFWRFFVVLYIKNSLQIFLVPILSFNLFFSFTFSSISCIYFHRFHKLQHSTCT